MHVCSPLYRDELKSLETKLGQAKVHYQHTLSQAKKDGERVSALPHFHINDKFLLNQDEAWYTLSIEIQVPIDNVMLQVSGWPRPGGCGGITVIIGGSGHHWWVGVTWVWPRLFCMSKY